MLLPQDILEISQAISATYTPIVAMATSNSAKYITLTTKDLAEISQEISRKYTPTLKANLPKLVLLPIDQSHLYASWSLGNAVIDASEKNKSTPILLRIYPQSDKNSNAPDVKPWYDITITENQTRKTVSIPTRYKASSYSAVIGQADAKGRFNVLASSFIAHLPASPHVVHTILASSQQLALPEQTMSRASSSANLSIN